MLKSVWYTEHVLDVLGKLLRSRCYKIDLFLSNSNFPPVRGAWLLTLEVTNKIFPTPVICMRGREAPFRLGRRPLVLSLCSTYS